QLGTALSVELPLTVSPALAVSASASPNPTTVGVPVALAALVSGGSPPVQSRWAISPGNGTLNATAGNYTFTSTGAYVATFQATDAAGATRVRTVSVEVYSAIVLEARANRTLVDAGMSIGFTATTTGGLLPLAYSWEFGDGGTATTNVTSHAYLVAGAYNATVWSND
ncbi:PKD domain-containing protein, partial [mine drainage metagenome]